MPVTFARTGADARVPDLLDRFIDEQTRVRVGGDPLAETEVREDKRPRPGLFSAIESTARSSWTAGVVNAAYRPAGDDPDFSPVDYIKRYPDLVNDPAVILLAERGQFDNTRTEQQFNFDLDAGRRLLDDLDLLGRSSLRVRLVAGFAAGAGDPLNFVPFGVAGRIAAGGLNVPRVARLAGTGAAFGLASKVAANVGLPAQDEPGIGDELASGFTAAALTAGIGFALSPSVPGVVRGLVPTSKVRHLVKELDASVNERPVTAIDYDRLDPVPDAPAVHRPRVESEIRAAFGDDAAEILPVMDAYARGWARGQGKSPDDYFAGLRVEKGGQPGEGALYSTLAWHGSPHVFDRFDVSKIGTGEGAQAYGHGLYFAGKREVAEWYRSKLAGPGGRLYKVELAPDEADFLDWDKPLSEQSEQVLAALKEWGGEDFGGFTPFDRGSEVYRWISDSLGERGVDPISNRPMTISDDAAASQDLRAVGIRGIRYLDGTSRADGGGTFNYVVFDDADVTIREFFQRGEAGQAQGSFELKASGERIIRALTNPDASTLPHEVGHDFLEQLPAMDADLARRAYSALGADDGRLTVEHKETFARGFEAYLRNGEAPSEGLRAAFERFRDFLVDLYKSIVGTPLEGRLSPQLKGVFDSMLTAGDAPTYRLRTSGEIKYAMGAAARPEFGRDLDGEVEAGRAFLSRVLTEAPVKNRVVVALPSPENKALVGKIREKYDRAGVVLHVVDHPDTRWYETVTLARQIYDDPNLAGEAKVGGPLGGLARLVGVVTPGGRIASTPFAPLENAYRTLSGSVSTLSRGSMADPMGNSTGTAAESLKSIYDGWKAQALLNVRRIESAARREGPITFRGEVVRNGAEFDKAVHDYLRQQAAVQAGYDPTFSVAPDALDDVHPSIVAAADSLRRYLVRIGKEAHAAGLLETFDPGVAYLPRVWDARAVRAGEADFKAALVSSFERATLRDKDGPIAPQERPLISEVADKLDQNQLQTILEAKLGRQPKPANPDAEPLAVGLVEGDLPDDLFVAYDQLREAYWRGNAESAAKKIIDPQHSHGVDAAIRPFTGRSLKIDESDLADYLVSDLREVVERYAFATHGRVGVGRAIALNPQYWRGVTLKDGTAVTDGETLVRRLHEDLDAVDAVARQQNRDAGLTDFGKGSATEAVRRLRRRIDADISIPLMVLEGRQPFNDRGVYGAVRYFGRSALRVSFLNKLGSTGLAQLGDLAPLVLHFIAHPSQMRWIPKAIRSLKSLPLDDLRAANLGLGGIVRERAINGVDDLVAGRGFGEGRTRRVTAGIELGSERVTDAFMRATGLPAITDIEHRLVGTIELARLTEGAQKMAAAKPGTLGGMTRREAAHLNRMGLNAERSRLYLEQLHKHGLTEDDVPLRELVTLDELLAGKPVPDGGTLKANYGEWDETAHSLRDVLLANLNAHVSRGVIVSPGLWDRPLINHRTWGRIFNQLQGFALAFGNQRLRAIAQMPWSTQLAHVMTYVALGALVDALSNHLSGRRSLDETARGWSDDPSTMMYGAVDRSGILGWIGRPLAISDVLQLPGTPSRVLGTPQSSAARHVEPGRVLTFLGPVASDVDRLGRVASLLSSGEKRDRDHAAYQAWKLAPAQNLIWLRLLHKGTGLPVVPEAIKPEPLR